MGRVPGRLLAAAFAAALSIAGGAAAMRAAQPAAAASGPARAWLGQEALIEAHLKSAAVTSLEDIGTGVTHPRRAHLDPAAPVESLVWKVLPPGKRNGFWESYKSEIAAYELDKLLGMHMVPPAVERTIGGETGAAVMWIGSVKSVKETGGKVPSGAVWGQALRQLQMFDNLIANIDRNAGNILIGAPGELILIDHSRAFTSQTKLQRPIERVDADLWQRMTALTRDDLTRVLAPWLDAEAIGAIIERRDRMAADVDKLVAKKGRAAVVIP